MRRVSRRLRVLVPVLAGGLGVYLTRNETESEPKEAGIEGPDVMIETVDYEGPCEDPFDRSRRCKTLRRMSNMLLNSHSPVLAIEGKTMIAAGLDRQSDLAIVLRDDGVMKDKVVIMAIQPGNLTPLENMGKEIYAVAQDLWVWRKGESAPDLFIRNSREGYIYIRNSLNNDKARKCQAVLVGADPLKERLYSPAGWVFP